MVLETSWGLLYTCLIPMPLLAWAVRPVGWVGPQVLAIAGCVLVAGMAGFALGQAFVAVFTAAGLSVVPAHAATAAVVGGAAVGSVVVVACGHCSGVLASRRRGAFRAGHGGSACVGRAR